MPRPRRILQVAVTALALMATAAHATPASAATPDGGAIDRHYEELGGALGNLGPAVSPVRTTPFRPGAYQLFNIGSIYWSAGTGAWDVHGLIRDNWASLGYENSALGFPTSDGNQLGGSAVFQTFEGGLSYYAPGVGAHEVRGAILGTYAALGHERSRLGFPVTNELGAPDRRGRFQVFQGGSVYWSTLTGAHEIEGDIRAKWGSIGYEQSVLGYPATDEVDAPDGGRQSGFLLGSINRKPVTGAYVSGFFAPVSDVDRAGSVFTVDRLDQDFAYDGNDTFLRLKLASGGTVAEPITLTKKQFTDLIGVDTFLIVKDYSLDPAAKATFEIVDLASVPTTLQSKAALVRALRG